MWEQIAKQISETTGELFEIANRRSIGGGCINQGSSINDGKRTYFVKFNRASQVEMFAAEALGVRQMWETQTIRVPQPICYGTAGNSAYLVLEWLDLNGRGGEKAWELMGRNLAKLHRQGTHDRFGWERNNTIGSTPQINPWTSDWAEFFTEHRPKRNEISRWRSPAGKNPRTPRRTLAPTVFSSWRFMGRKCCHYR
jgi:fructosamine-3-kinase